MITIKIAVCDDEKNIADLICDKIKNTMQTMNYNFEIDTFYNGYDLLENCPQQYDVLFLDIYLCDINGYELAEKIRNVDSKIIIVFLTSSSDFVFDGYKLGVFRYVLKKNFCDEINDLIISLNDVLKDQKSYIVEKSKSGFKKIICDDIIYINSDLRKVNIFTKNGVESFYGKISEIEKKLSQYKFIRTHQSYLVNYKYIKALKPNSIELCNNISIPISRPYLKITREKMLKYIK